MAGLVMAGRRYPETLQMCGDSPEANSAQLNRELCLVFRKECRERKEIQ